MDPQAFIRLSIGSLGLRIPGSALNFSKAGICAFSSPCSCEIRLRGFPVQTTSVPLVSSPEAAPDIHSIASSFYLEDSDMKALLTPGCFYNPHAYLEITVFTGRKGHIVVLESRDSRLEHSSWRVAQLDPLSTYWLGFADSSDIETERRERKGWKVKILDLSGLAVAAAFITTPFVASTACDWVARSNLGAWLIVRPDVCRPESWLPWGKLEAWRERGIRDSGGEFFIDTDRQMREAPTPVPSPQSSGDVSALSPIAGGFVMSCIVQGEGKSSRPLVQLAMRHVTCAEDAAIFMALGAAVDLSIEACKPFRRKIRIGSRHSL
ncbi:hypothetical protein CRYUN_Cryun05aG0048900 [Craigia yunnanensis]